MDESNSILIDRYLSNQLTAEELLQFEERMQQDAAFKAEVELHKDIVGGISDYGKNLMRAEIAAAGIEAKSNLENYKPSKGGGNWGWTLLKGLIFLAALGGVGFPLLVHNNKIEVDPHVKSEIEQMINKVEERGFSPAPAMPTRGDTLIRVETIYHTIKTKTVKPGDTVIITSEEEYKEYLERQERETRAVPAN